MHGKTLQQHLAYQHTGRVKLTLRLTTFAVYVQTGASIHRQSRSRAVTSRPKAGWSMVVQDVSKEGSKKQFVALPGGRTRRLTADEEVYLERMQPKRRKKIV